MIPAYALETCPTTSSPDTALEYYTGVVLNALEFWIAKQAKLLTNVCDASRKKWERPREYTDSCVGIDIMFLSSWPSCPTNAKLPLIIRVVLAIILHLTSLFGAYTYIYYLFLQQGEEKETINVIDNSRG